MTKATTAYFERIRKLIDRVEQDEDTELQHAADLIATSIANGGIVHMFGSGHSNLLAQEVFHRAGGLVPVNAMLDVNLTIFGSARATMVERLEGYAPSVITSYDIRPGEVVIVISTSGVNPVPIEIAQRAKELGATAIAVMSASEYADAPSRHSSGARLADVVDLVLDTHVPIGDAVQPIGDGGIVVGATSTILGAVLLNALFVSVAEELAARGEPVPAFVSQNIPGGDEHNQVLIERFRPRIPLMKP
jgi:uncharacterized phosphosugar-binding protein